MNVAKTIMAIGIRKSTSTLDIRRRVNNYRRRRQPWRDVIAAPLMLVVLPLRHANGCVVGDAFQKTTCAVEGYDHRIAFPMLLEPHDATSNDIAMTHGDTARLEVDVSKILPQTLARVGTRQIPRNDHTLQWHPLGARGRVPWGGILRRQRPHCNRPGSMFAPNDSY